MFFVALAIVVLWSGFFFGVAAAGEVTRINKNKGHIFVNEGKDAGFIKGAVVCFFSPSGEKLLCGRILRTSDAFAVVKVNNRKAKKIKIGTAARLYDEQEENM
jgi:hypothetical protein